MIFKYKHQLLGGHVHIGMWAGKNINGLGKVARMILREEEWNAFRSDSLMLNHISNGNTYIFEEIPLGSKEWAVD